MARTSTRNAPPPRRAPDPVAQLRAAVDERTALATAATFGDRIDALDPRWAAARQVLVTATRQLLRARGQPLAGALATLATPEVSSSPTRSAAVAVLADLPAATAPLPPPPSFAWLGNAYPHLLAPVARKQSGAWFTVPALTLPTAQRTLAGDRTHAGPMRIVDPAAGAGAFLLAALATRVAVGCAPATVVTEELFGLDLDPTAAQLAAAALHEACGAAAPPLAAIAANVRCGDGLIDLVDGTFDAVLGNPPWETLQTARTESTTNARAAALSARVAMVRTRFHHQGRGKLYTYRLFLERALQLLRPGGRLGLIVPASLYFDRDAAPLREVLLRDCAWEWLFAFENRRRLFAIDGRYRFGAILARKGGTTTAVRVAFGRVDPEEWAGPAPRHLLYPAAEVRRLSPRSGAFVEVQDQRDLELLRRLALAGQPLLGTGGACSWRQGDFNMTADRHRFHRRDECERRGYAACADGSWRGDGDAPVLRPLYQGAMIHHLHPNAGAHAGGTGRSTSWRPPPADDAVVPQYLVAADDHRCAAPARVAVRALSNATNERTAIACLLADEPCGNSLGLLTPRAPTVTPVTDTAFTAGVLASLAWDWALRQRLAGTNVNGFVLADMVLPCATPEQRRAIAAAAVQLGAILPWHEPLRRAAVAEGLPAWTGPIDRASVRIRLELAVADAFGLEPTDLDWMLRDCDHPVTALANRVFARRLDPKGFWRVDRELPPSARLPMRVRAAAHARISAPA